MKKIVFIIVAVVLLAGLGWYGAGRSVSPVAASALSQRPAAAPPTETISDPAAVFRRAFWKHPGAQDRILHAERREWSAAGGIQKWQWFLTVQPSPELLKYLRDDNAFNLAPATAAAASSSSSADAPQWFYFEPSDVEVLKAPVGNLTLIFSKSANLLYATDAGTGFRPGAPEAPAAASVLQTAAAPAGRLPTTAPPKP